MSLRSGKLPPELLAELLAKIPHRDARVLQGPAVGRDAAVIDLGDRVLVGTTDPITFATDDIGRYAVHVNANDIACMGGRPAWFLATALLPEGCDASLPGTIFDQIVTACDDLGIELVGGHTEVTRGIDRPIIAGTMIGEATHDAMPSGDVQAGDVVLMTKGIAIEGTAVLGREAALSLAAAGVARADVDRAAKLLHDPGISVLRDASVLGSAVRPKMLHDPTEGGISSALYELATAASMRLYIDLGKIDVLPETERVCAALGIDALGLLASGALLAIVGANDVDAALTALADAGITCREIGTAVTGPVGVILGAEDRAPPFPTFARDELARFFESASGPAKTREGSPEGM